MNISKQLEYKYLVCKTRDCNQGIQPGVPLGEHTDTHHLQNNNHTLQTTNIRASFADYTHEETRMHLPFYRVHVANAYKQWPVALVREDELVIASGVENSAQKVKYDAKDNEVDPRDIPLQLKPVYIFDRLLQTLVSSTGSNLLKCTPLSSFSPRSVLL